MRVEQFIVTLLDDVVISQRAANIGGHSSLDYLPGGVFLGAAAAKLYGRLGYESAYDVFHGGQVRFGDALPFTESGHIAYPVPRCWHRRKNEHPTKANIRNFLVKGFPENIQAVQYRQQFFSFDPDPKHQLLTVSHRFQMKTAVDPNQGAAADNQLFGYSALAKGMRFSFRVEADSQLPAGTFELIRESLQGRLSVGRSRSAEYGLVEVESCPSQESLNEPVEEKGVTLWLLADAAFEDSYGQPTLQPDSESLGLPNMEIDWTRSYVYSRRYAPFNTWYQRYELERWVLGMGSVLYFCDREDSKVSVDILRQIQLKGVGLYRQAGLGRVWVNPPVLRDEVAHPGKSPLCVGRAFAAVPVEPVNHPIYRYLKRRVESNREAQDIEETVKQWTKDLRDLYQSAAALSPFVHGACIGPAPSQWGRIMEVTKSKPLPDNKTLIEKLFGGPGEKQPTGICKRGDRQWDQRVVCTWKMSNGEPVDSFTKWLNLRIEQNRDNQQLPKIVARVARQAMDIARDQTGPSASSRETEK